MPFGPEADAPSADEKITETMAAVALPGEQAMELEADEPPTDEVQVLEVDEPPLDPEAGGGSLPGRPRARSISGEIRLPRAASIKPPMPDPHLGDDEDDEPLISIEEGTRDDGKAPRMVPVRRRVKTDPPELKARAGEVSLDKRPDRSVNDQPRIIIDDDAARPGRAGVQYSPHGRVSATWETARGRRAPLRTRSGDGEQCPVLPALRPIGAACKSYDICRSRTAATDPFQPVGTKVQFSRSLS